MAWEPKSERFSVDGGYLTRNVESSKGTTYTHRCTRETFERVAHAIEEGAATLEEIAKREGTRLTQTNVALAFLKERGIVEPAPRRRHIATTESTYLDAMVEFEALATRFYVVTDTPTGPRLANAIAWATLEEAMDAAARLPNTDTRITTTPPKYIGGGWTA